MCQLCKKSATDFYLLLIDAADCGKGDPHPFDGASARPVVAGKPVEPANGDLYGDSKAPVRAPCNGRMALTS
jgi:hypothetical protein